MEEDEKKSRHINYIREPFVIKIKKSPEGTGLAPEGNSFNCNYINREKKKATDVYNFLSLCVCVFKK